MTMVLTFCIWKVHCDHHNVKNNGYGIHCYSLPQKITLLSHLKRQLNPYLMGSCPFMCLLLRWTHHLCGLITFLAVYCPQKYQEEEQVVKQIWHRTPMSSGPAKTLTIWSTLWVEQQYLHDTLWFAQWTAWDLSSSWLTMVLYIKHSPSYFYACVWWQLYEKAETCSTFWTLKHAVSENTLVINTV